MNKIRLLIAGGVCVVALAAIFLWLPRPMSTQPIDTIPPTMLAASSPLNATYIIMGQYYTLVNGRVEKEVAPNSATKEKVSVFGEPVLGDLDKDGDVDAALFLVQESGGSGTFYYAAIALNEGGVYKGLNAILLGDRIAPQNMEIRDGRAVANYAERKATDPFTTPPSVGKSLFIHIDPATDQIGELAENFEGEADPAHMTLDMHKWKWVRTTHRGDTILEPKKKDAFTVSFQKDGKFALTTDCNNSGGTYAAKKSAITFSGMFATMMFCEGSQEAAFTAQFGAATYYQFTTKGELLLDLPLEGGRMVFVGI